MNWSNNSKTEQRSARNSFHVFDSNVMAARKKTARPNERWEKERTLTKAKIWDFLDNKFASCFGIYNESVNSIGVLECCLVSFMQTGGVMLSKMMAGTHTSTHSYAAHYVTHIRFWFGFCKLWATAWNGTVHISKWRSGERERSSNGKDIYLSPPLFSFESVASYFAYYSLILHIIHISWICAGENTRSIFLSLALSLPQPQHRIVCNTPKSDKTDRYENGKLCEYATTPSKNIHRFPPATSQLS